MPVRIFVSYSRVDRAFMDQVVEKLSQVFGEQDLWFDKKLTGGKDWWKEILTQINQCDIFIYLLTRESIESEYCTAEFSEALRLKKTIIPIQVRQIPIRIPERISRLQIVDLSEGITTDNLPGLYATIWQYKEEAPAEAPAVIDPTPTPMPSVPSDSMEIKRSGRPPLKLCDRITQEQWRYLEQIVIQAATSGGMAAMSLYRQTMQWPEELGIQEQENKNPSTLADLQATSAILQTIDLKLSPIARKLGCPLLFLGEETRYYEWFERNLSGSASQSIQTSEEFFTTRDNIIRVILDGIDGTGSFVRGMKLFCSSVAILIDDQVRASAVYDPIHHVVYSAVLMGPYDAPESRTSATAFEVSTGHRVNLAQLALETEPKSLKQEAIGIHLTRTNSVKLHEFLQVPSHSHESQLERLAKASAGVYALGSGIVAMADVARGALGAFVNNITNLWDVASGEVLIRACGGKVTDFSGAAIDYTYPAQISLVTARDEAIHSHILDLLKQ